jgi:hypothetical protein
MNKAHSSRSEQNSGRSEVTSVQVEISPLSAQPSFFIEVRGHGIC